MRAVAVHNPGNGESPPVPDFGSMSGVQFVSPEPRRVATPRWLDIRLVLGVALVAAAVLLGAVVVARARHTERIVAVSRNLAAGTTLHADDLRTVDAQVPGGTYVGDPGRAVGRVLSRPLAAGELLPLAVLGSAPARTTVTVPFGADAAPQLHRGQRIVVWLSTPTCPNVVLLPDVAVQDVHATDAGFGAGSGGQDAVLSLAPDLAERVIGALAIDKAAIRAGVLTGPVRSASPLPSLGGCAASDSP
jgi:hypothetical protein